MVSPLYKITFSEKYRSSLIDIIQSNPLCIHEDIQDAGNSQISKVLQTSCQKFF